MPNTVPAADPGLPVSEPSRRGFLHGLRRLAALPLIGGGVTLIGAPMAAAEPVTEDLIHSYKAWLHYEHRMLSYELAGYDERMAQLVERHFYMDNEGAHWHFRSPRRNDARIAGWEYAEQPSKRAALVLSAVGCNWKRGGAL